VNWPKKVIGFMAVYRLTANRRDWRNPVLAQVALFGCKIQQMQISILENSRKVLSRFT
jgi:hypothetical protein